MRKFRLYLAWMGLMMALGVTAQTPQAKAEEKREALPDHLRMDISYMIPRRYQGRQVSDFSLEIKGDTAVLCLPYMGEVWVPAMSYDGLHFTAPMQDVRRGKTKHGEDVVSFRVRNANVVYHLQLLAAPGGKAELYLRPSNAQDCRYEGDWKGLHTP